MARMTYIGLGFMMIVLVVGTLAAVGFATRHHAVSDSLFTTGAATAVAWLLGAGIVTGSGIDTAHGAGERLAITPALVPAFLFTAGAIVSVNEAFTLTTKLRRKGFDVKLWLPRWVIITGWATLVVGAPYATIMGAGAIAGSDLTSSGADALVLLAIIEALVLMAIGAVHVWIVRPQRERRNLAPVYAAIGDGWLF